MQRSRGIAPFCPSLFVFYHSARWFLEIPDISDCEERVTTVTFGRHPQILVIDFKKTPNSSGTKKKKKVILSESKGRTTKLTFLGKN